MVNHKRDTARGSGYEKRAMRWLEAHGYYMHRANRAAIFLGPGRVISRRVDLWSCVDLAGLHATEKVRLVQVGTLAHRALKKHTVEERLAGHFNPAVVDAEVWSWGKWRDRGYGFLVERYLAITDWDKPWFLPSKEAR